VRHLARFHAVLTCRDANRFFQLMDRRYTRSSIVITSNKRVSEWAELFGDEILASAILDRLLHDAETLTINAPWRVRGRGDLLASNAKPAEDGENSPTDTSRHPAQGSRRALTTPSSRSTRLAMRQSTGCDAHGIDIRPGRIGPSSPSGSSPEHWARSPS